MPQLTDPFIPTLKSVIEVYIDHPILATFFALLIAFNLNFDEFGMTGEFRAGWQVRRSVPQAQECPGDENGGKTWGDWYSCCPKGTFPKRSGEDRWCDDGKGTAGNSTAHPQCASSKWSLFTLNDYYFCCDAGSEDRGYYYANTDDYYFGCASNDWISNDAGSDVRRADSFPNPRM